MTVTASIIGANFLTVMISGVTHTINRDHANYDAIRSALRDKNFDEVESLINVRKSVESFVQGKITVEADRVLYGDLEIRGSVVNRILAMRREGFDAQPMMKFLENLMQNPSKRAVDELYGFLEATNLPITEDGFFLAYKKVRDDYMDFYTGKMDNSVGQTPEMPRNQVDDNKDRTCSDGLHFCSLTYLPHYHGGSGRVMIVKINPRDVVSIPSDYDNAKGRACKYEVIGENTTDTRETENFFTAPVYDNMTPVTPSKNRSSGNSALVGYNQGRSDAANSRGYNDIPVADYDNDDYARYIAAYEKGYNSIAKTTAGTESNVEYTDGYASGEHDYNNGFDYADLSGETEDYATGYEDGWFNAEGNSDY